MPDAAIPRDDILSLTERILLLSMALEEKQATERIRLALRQYRSGLFKIVVVGEIKKGKSSFINALLGDPELLPAMSDVATSTVYKIMDGSRKAYKAIFLPEDPNRPVETARAPIDLERDQVADYGVEDGNPGNAKKIDFIGVQLPHLWLRSGVLVIDTPGLGGLFRHHADITWRYVPGADAIFFVLDSVEALASQAEMDYLVRLRKMSPYIFFVQTKIDQTVPERWQAWRDRNIEIISQTLGLPREKIIYFTISSKLKNLADKQQSPSLLNESGFIPLTYFVQEKLVKGKEDRAARVLLASLAAEAQAIGRNLAGSRQILSTSSRNALDALERDYASARARHEQWRANEFQRALRDFQDASADLRRKAVEQIQSALDPSPHGDIVRPILEQLRTDEVTAEEIVADPAPVQSACIELCNQQVFDIQGRYNQDMVTLISATLTRIGTSSDVIEAPVSIRGSMVKLVDALDVHFSGFEKMRNTFFGGTAGTAIATALASMFFPPAGVGMAVASMAGGIMGAFFTRRDHLRKQKEQAVGKITAVLVDAVRVAQKQAMQQFNDTSTGFERSARDSFESAAQETQRRLENKQAEIAEARKLAREESQAKVAHLNKMIDQAAALLTDIEKLTGRAAQKAA